MTLEEPPLSPSASENALLATIPLYSQQAALAWLEASLKTFYQDPSPEVLAIESSVKTILNTIKTQGDSGVRAVCEQLGDPLTDSFEVSKGALEKAFQTVSPEVLKTLTTAHQRILRFGEAIMEKLTPVQVSQESFSGAFEVGLNFVPVQSAGCYVPAGRYPLPSTALMTATTAKVAGVQEIILVSPRLSNEILVAGQLAGVTRFFQVGGAQAIGALAYGTESIPGVDVIVGPGNAYVTEAKKQVQGLVGIDMLAGPSEVGIIADAGANPRWVALDLISQAEHDPHARAYLFTDSQKLAESVQALVPQLVQELGLPEYLKISLGKSALLVFDNLTACVAAANQIAPEHLQVNIKHPESIQHQLKNFGGLFLGYGATVPFGDYMAGPNHTLPTGRTARFTGGLNPLTFLRPQSWIQVDTQKVQGLAQETADFANLEGLKGHAAAALERI